MLGHGAQVVSSTVVMVLCAQRRLHRPGNPFVRYSALSEHVPCVRRVGELHLCKYSPSPAIQSRRGQDPGTEIGVYHQDTKTQRRVWKEILRVRLAVLATLAVLFRLPGRTDSRVPNDGIGRWFIFRLRPRRAREVPNHKARHGRGAPSSKSQITNKLQAPNHKPQTSTKRRQGGNSTSVRPEFESLGFVCDLVLGISPPMRRGA
jgi:hypothetical protein